MIIVTLLSLIYIRVPSLVVSHSWVVLERHILPSDQRVLVQHASLRFFHLFLINFHSIFAQHERSIVWWKIKSFRATKPGSL